MAVPYLDTRSELLRLHDRISELNDDITQSLERLHPRSIVQSPETLLSLSICEALLQKAGQRLEELLLRQ